MEKVFRTGIGFDVHRLAEHRRCIIGGVEIPSEKGLLGHSDADVLAHALSDAFLGAAGLGDIGTYFPDTDPAFKDADSIVLLRKVRDEIIAKGYEIINADCVIICEYPKINPYRDAMKKRIASTLEVDISQIGIKASTSEKLGFTGRMEGVAAQAVVSIYGPLKVFI